MGTEEETSSAVIHPPSAGWYAFYIAGGVLLGWLPGMIVLAIVFIVHSLFFDGAPQRATSALIIVSSYLAGVIILVIAFVKHHEKGEAEASADKAKKTQS